MKTQNNDNTQAPNADDFLGGNYLKKEDIDGQLSDADWDELLYEVDTVDSSDRS